MLFATLNVFDFASKNTILLDLSLILETGELYIVCSAFNVDQLRARETKHA